MAPLSRTGSAGSIEGVSRALSAVTDRDTYRRLAYLSTALLLGTLWFAGLVTGFARTVALAVTPLVLLVVVGLGVFVQLAVRAECSTVRSSASRPTRPRSSPGRPPASGRCGGRRPTRSAF